MVEAFQINFLYLFNVPDTGSPPTRIHTESHWNRKIIQNIALTIISVNHRRSYLTIFSIDWMSWRLNRWGVDFSRPKFAHISKMIFLHVHSISPEPQNRSDTHRTNQQISSGDTASHQFDRHNCLCFWFETVDNTIIRITSDVQFAI